MPTPALPEIYNAAVHPFSPEDREFIRRAYEFAEQAHRGQKRKSGEDYLSHTAHVARILAEIGMDAKAVSAGLLHDVPEDTAVSLAEVERGFGAEVAHLVDGITKLGKIKLRGSREEYFLENLRKMFLAMAQDIRVVIIKLADRLHNMRTLEYLPKDKQERIATETRAIFAPLANRLGIGEIKGELEDLCFKYLEPAEYQKTRELAETYMRESEAYLRQAIDRLRQVLTEARIDVLDIHGRTKHLYRLWLKLKRHDADITRVYDLIAIRIIVPDIADCYESLGIIHREYRPMVGRIKDYISLPKPNGYQSIHTTVFGPKGRIIEVQVRTRKMHDEAEYGIAAHWMYTENVKTSWRNFFLRKKKDLSPPKKELTWVQQLKEWQKEVGQDNQEFMEGLRIEFFKDRIFAFTPKGDIIELPEEATPVDFAYAIHSDIGHRTTGAKADGKMVPLDYHIQNGQVIEILVSRDMKKPSRDWLGFVKTSSAKSKIRHELKQNQN